jgi:protein-S-isoprenylcysteine O-methyltransferase Ste14
MKYLDYPPVWLVAFLGIAWVQSQTFTLNLSFGPVWAPIMGGLLVGAGVLLMLLALVEFYKHKTTFVPRKESSAFIQSGIFKRSRNPIYLGDLLVLAGMILYWDAALSLPLIPVFMWVIEKRFILGEEKHLRQTYRLQYATYCQKTRRWL